MSTRSIVGVEHVTYLDRCPYCGTGPCTGSPRTANGKDVDRWYKHHPRTRETRTVLRGRYVHFDGSPAGVGEALMQIVRRDGVDKAIHVLTVAHTEWSCVDAAGGEPRGDIPVAGYGVAYSDARDQWLTPGDSAGAQYAYVLAPDRLLIHKVIGDRWEPVEARLYEEEARGRVVGRGPGWAGMAWGD